MFSKTPGKLSLFKRNKHHRSSQILHVTDSEGHIPSFVSAVNNSRTVRYHPDSGLSFCNTVDMPNFVYGGDASGRGNGDLELSEALIDFKRRHPAQVFLIVGNRDISQNRFKFELDPAQIKQRLLETRVPHWLLNNPTRPLDYVHAVMTEQKNSGSDMEFVHSLSFEQCQLIYLKWMLEKTMGCPHGFRYRKEALEKIHGFGEVTDSMVLQSFIKESSPDGIMGQYLQLGQVGVVVPHTRVLAVHGGLQPNNIGWIPGMGANEERIEDIHTWIGEFNNAYAKQIQKWVNSQPGELTRVAFTELDDWVLPVPGQTKSIITADMLNSDRQFVGVHPEVSRYLLKNRMQVVLTGHQPSGDCPAIIRDNGLLVINGDTGYADPKTTDNTRGAAVHTLEIFVDGHVSKIDLQATLSDKSWIRTKLHVNEDLIEGDPYIGQVTSNHQLIQCLSPDGSRYRLARQNGFKVEYSTMSVMDVMQLFEGERAMMNTCQM